MGDQQRLGRYVKRRRLELRLTQRKLAARAGIGNRITVAAVEDGKAVSDLTLARLDYGLAWAPGSAEETLAGGEPTPLAQPDDGPELRDDIERQLWAIQGLSDARKWVLIEHHRKAAHTRGRGQKRSRAS